MWNGPPVDDELKDALKARFIELCIFHNANLSSEFPHPAPSEVGKYVFAEKKLPELNGELMGNVWHKDFTVIEAVRLGCLKGSGPLTDADEKALIRRSLKVADAKDASLSVVLSAIRLAGELQGLVKKGVEGGGKTPSDANTASDFLAQIAKALPN